MDFPLEPIKTSIIVSNVGETVCLKSQVHQIKTQTIDGPKDIQRANESDDDFGRRLRDNTHGKSHECG